ncbi:MAG TPA: GntR family transcriptional regulator [Acidimicrobiales bacterium]|nr:GntR family transcriptional regulator [Acidimicrobiales bacterium]
MLLVALDPNDATPLHEQTAGSIRRAIIEGQCKPGDRLPPARDIAAALGVNANTVLRALRGLRDEGALEFRRGRGITVASGAGGRAELVARAKELTRLARRQGFSREELIEMIRELR